MSHPHRTTSMVSPLMLRDDLGRETATAYWATAHADKVKKLPNLVEYNQRHFSPTDHGFWPATTGVGTTVDDTWRIDGCSEIRFRSMVAALATALHAREVYLDEQNLFARVLGQPTAPGGGRWWTDGFDDTAGHHVALLLRRRSGVKDGAFSSFVHNRIAAALRAGGVRDLRTYTFLPYTPLIGASPGVAHDNPPQRRYHAAVLFGIDSRSAVDELIKSDPVSAVVEDQHTVLTAVHAYSVERSVPVVRPGRRS
ncbi:EthD domain-containing protein [Nocardia sp. NPDC059240]|uniref:EthD domain-containing protein n=1 Tax=Nocardia sp. NPDC059240 TaxID=3346786 RepID=UPI0036BD1863